MSAHAAPEQPARLVAGWQLVALVALVGAVLLGAFFMLDPATRAHVIEQSGTVLAPHVTTILSAVAASVAGLYARKVHKETQAQTPMIRETQANTNGRLTALQAERDTAIRQLAELRAAVVAPAPAPAPESYPVGASPGMIP